MKKVKLDIIRYARKVFKDTGRPPSVREILKEFKVSSRTFYKYFPNVNELYRLANIPTKTKSRDSEHEYYRTNVTIARENIKIKLSQSFNKLFYYLKKFKEDARVDAIRRSAMVLYADVEDRLNKARNFKELKVVEEYVKKTCMLYDKWLNEVRDRYIWMRAEEEHVRWAVDKIVKQMIRSRMMEMRKKGYWHLFD